jgi:predicted nucleotidyltransferase
VRLPDSERRAIRQAVERRFGSDARALLFGSRADDTRRGGDIDLLVEVPHAVADPLMQAVQLEVDVMRAIGERKIDVLLAYPGCGETPIHSIARKTAVPL